MRLKTPEYRGQDPKGWFTKGYTDNNDEIEIPHNPLVSS